MTALLLSPFGEEEEFDFGCDDGFQNLADDWEQADWSVVAGI